MYLEYEDVILDEYRQAQELTNKPYLSHDCDRYLGNIAVYGSRIIATPARNIDVMTAVRALSGAGYRVVYDAVVYDPEHWGRYLIARKKENK